MCVGVAIAVYLLVHKYFRTKGVTRKGTLKLMKQNIV